MATAVKYELLRPNAMRNAKFVPSSWPRRAITLALATLTCLLFFFYSVSPASSLYYPYESSVVVSNLNNIHASPNAAQNGQHILILTPLKDAEPYLEKYFANIAKFNYPKSHISLAFLVSDTTDNTIDALRQKADQINNHWDPRERYHRITILQKDFHFDLPNDQRHKYEMQEIRRSHLARARNYLLTAALNEEHSWVLWLDVDVTKFDANIITDLQGLDKDVIVPNCLWEREDNEFWAYDRNNWQETDASRELQKTIDKDYVLVEGYYEFPTHRYHMVDMPTHLGKLAAVPLDGIGATFTLVKARVHREGANFPTVAYEHQVETEGFAKMAKRMGFEVYGLPGYIVYHAMNS